MEPSAVHRDQLIAEWDGLTDETERLYVARVEALTERGWKAVVLPAGRPDAGTLLPSGRSELDSFFAVSGGSAFVLQPDYGTVESADSLEELASCMSRLPDDFIVLGGNMQICMVVADAEAHVVVGEPGALVQFCDRDLEGVVRSLAEWLENHKQYAVDFGVMQRLLGYYEPVVLDIPTS